jgi:5-hydroxyisourate hydrolase-like protein (transthyretin family)
VREIYPDVKCLGFCYVSQFNDATPISVAAGSTVSGIDFSLVPGSTVTGTARNTADGSLLQNITVSAYALVGTTATQFGSATTNASGVYRIQNLPTGTYFLLTSTFGGFRNEIYDDIACIASCSSSTAVAMGTPVAVGMGATSSGRDFGLDAGGTITGTLTNAVTGAPLPNSSVFAYTRVGTSTLFDRSATTNAAGQYSITGLSPTDHFVYTNTGLATNEIYGNILCPLGCSSSTAVESGTAVPVTLGGTASGIDFILDPGGGLSGTVTNQATGLPVSGASVVVVTRAGNSIFTRSTTTNSSGLYSLTTGNPTGSYALYTNSSGFNNEIFDDIACNPFCSSSTAHATGTLVPVTSGAVTGGRNFALQPWPTGTIAGTVIDAASGLPIAGVTLDIWRVVGGSVTLVSAATTAVSGAYSASGLSVGSYLVSTRGNHTFRNETFDDIPCLGMSCSTAVVATGTQVGVTAGGTATANFGLSRGDGITGTVTDAATALPLPNVTVQLYQSPSGLFAGSATSNGLGQFFLRGAPNGTYVAFTSNSLGYRNEIFNNIPCATSCSVNTAIASGTAITVTGAAAFVDAQLLPGIDFALNLRTDAPGAPSNLRIVTSASTARFTWSAPSLFNGAAPTSYLLEAGGAPGATFITLPVPGTGTSFSVPNVPPGAFYVRLRALNGTAAGPASNEVRLVVGAGGVGLPDAPTSLVAFMSGSLLTMTWSPALGGGPPSGFIVEAGSASGASNIASLPVTAATFSFTPVPPGFYFLRVRARNAAGVSEASTEVMIVVSGAPAPPGAPSFTSHSVSGNTVTLNWQAPTQGTATSYIIEAGSAPGLANLAVANTGSTALTASFSGVPAGTYYVRLRAVNAQGASVVSNERTITVS